MLGLIQNLDMKLLLLIHSAGSPVLDVLMPLVTSLGNNGFIWIITGLILIMTKKFRKAGILLFCALILATVTGEVIIKNIIQRPRPFTALPDVKVLISRPNSYSFPSGHTAVGIAVSTVLVRSMGKYGVPFVFLAVLIAFSRMYVMVHYPTDVLGGVLLGLLCAATVLCFSDEIIRFLGKIYTRIKSSKA